MKDLDYRWVAALCVPWMLAGCPEDPVPADDDDGALTGSTTAVSTDESTAAPSDTTTDPPPDTSGGPMVTSGTTEAVDSSSSDSSPGSTGPISICGNNVLEGDEVCDLAQLNGESCESLGYEGGQLGCLLTCEDYNLLGCFICGNEVIDIAEDCEGSVPDDVTCTGLGFEGGEITCGDDCLYDLSDCSLCGDGIRQGPEQCDGLDFDGQTCASVGFDSGNLACNVAQCAFVYTGCVGGMYIQNFEAGAMMPIEFNVDPGTPWFVDDVNPINGAYSARSGAFPVGVGGITNLTLDASFPMAGNVSFEYETSTADGVDFLQFYMDGILQNSWTGIFPPANFAMAVPAGNHTFVWRFQRDGFLDAGQNAVWVDDITLDGGVPL